MKGVKVFVLGHRGMLGHVVHRYLSEQGFEVLASEARHTGDLGSPLLREIRRAGCRAVVNCIGQRLPDTNEKAFQLWLANALLPQQLALALGEEGLLVHASSDGVFSGISGAPFRIDSPCDAEDSYGASKRLGELCLKLWARAVVMRCSIIGPELGPPRSMLGWFLSQREPVDGFTDHVWNGITTLTWAKLCARAILGDRAVAPGLHQPACEQAVSKFELLSRIGAAFHHPVTVRPLKSGHPIDRTLKPTLPCSAIEVQLDELRSWYRR